MVAWRDGPMAGWRSPAAVAACVVAFVAAVALSGHLATGVVLLTVMFTVPGWLFLSACGLAREWSVRTVIYAVAVSVAILILAALVVNTLGPPVGVRRPLAAAPYTVTLVAICLLLVVVVGRREGPGLHVRWPRPHDRGRPVARYRLTWPLVLPVVGAAGTQLLDNTSRAWLVWVALVGTGLVLVGGLVTAGRPLGASRAPFVLYGAATTLLWSYSLRTTGLFGYDVRQEYASFTFVHDALHWVPRRGDAYTAMLSITSLPTALSQVTGISGLTLFKVVYPAVFGLFPVCVYALARRWLGPRPAMLVACLVVLQPSFPEQMPSLARQEIALLLFLCLMVAWTDRALGAGQRRALVLVLGAAMVLSHYSTTYVGIVAVVGWLLIGQCFRRRMLPRPGVGDWAAGVAVVALAVVWYGPVTHSTTNLSETLAGLTSNPLIGLTASPGKQSFISSWLSGHSASGISAAGYFQAAKAAYVTGHSWFHPYAASVARTFPVVDDPAPVDAALIPHPGAPVLATVVFRQLLNVTAALGVLIVAVQVLRRRVDPALLAISLPLFAITVLARINLQLALDYNPERLALQTSPLVLLPATVGVRRIWNALARSAWFAWRPARWGPPRRGSRRALLAAAGLAGLVTLVYLDASQLGARLEGGGIPGNLSVRGEESERLDWTSSDLLASRWISADTPTQASVYADRYGGLLVLAGGGLGRAPVLPDITPGTLDRRAYVYASSVNITLGRARGETPDGTGFATYRFPEGFLDEWTAVVFDTGTARVYR